nr:TNF receptor-associated factor 3 [Arenicola marina]
MAVQTSPSMSSLSSLLPNPKFLSLDDKYKCCICVQPLEDPVMSECGHRMCRACIEEKLSSTQSVPCPAGAVDCETVTPDTIFTDFGVMQDMKRLPVYCTNESLGCTEIPLWKDLSTHLQTCEFPGVECPLKQFGCGQMVAKDKIDEHLLKECSFRPRKCRYCGISVPERLMEGHVETGCIEAELLCPNLCGKKIKKKELLQHESECPAKIIQCRYPGCQFQERQERMVTHEKEKVAEHLSYLFELWKTSIPQADDNLGAGASCAASPAPRTKEEKEDAESSRQEKEAGPTKPNAKTFAVQNADESITELQAEVAAWKEKCEELSGIHDDMEERLKRQEHFVKGVQNTMGIFNDKFVALEQASRHDKELLRKENEQLQKRIRDLESKQGELNDKKWTDCQHRMEGLEEKFQNVDFRLQCSEMATYNGVLLWKITDVKRRKRAAASGRTVSLYSQPFYATRFGYKMCARIFLNGDGLGKGTHVSLYFMLMKGEHDALLRWPFNLTVVLTLMDQEDGRRNIVDSFRPDPTSNSFRRPEQDINIGSGCPLFVANSVLESGPYLKGDCMFIKIATEATESNDAAFDHKRSSLTFQGGNR